MSERRPHWDDDLIFAVIGAVEDPIEMTVEDAYSILASVEDWQKAHRRTVSKCSTAGEPLCECCYDWYDYSVQARQAEATIQRVREWAVEARSTPNDYDEDTEERIMCGKEVLRLLGCVKTCHCGQYEFWRGETWSKTFPSNVLHTDIGCGAEGGDGDD